MPPHDDPAAERTFPLVVAAYRGGSGSTEYLAEIGDAACVKLLGESVAVNIYCGHCAACVARMLRLRDTE